MSSIVLPTAGAAYDEDCGPNWQDSPDEGKFFGKERHSVEGEHLFSEFLATITDSSVVVREEEVLDTRRFIDEQTRTLQVVMVSTRRLCCCALSGRQSVHVWCGCGCVSG